MKLLITCEHAFNEIPAAYFHLFQSSEDILNSHEGYDPGSYDLFCFLKPLADHQFYQKMGRLLVEVNRSVHHPKLFSRFTKKLTEKEKTAILEQYYFPYRNTIEKTITDIVEREEILHVSIHSFTPQLNGEIRNCDIGLLYDPACTSEKNQALMLRKCITAISDYKVRMNYPYLGKADGFTAYLRRKFPRNYAGIEIEINQKYAACNQFPEELKQVIYHSLESIKKAA